MSSSLEKPNFPHTTNRWHNNSRMAEYVATCIVCLSTKQNTDYSIQLRLKTCVFLFLLFSFEKIAVLDPQDSLLWSRVYHTIVSEGPSMLLRLLGLLVGSWVGEHCADVLSPYPGRRL